MDHATPKSASEPRDEFVVARPHVTDAVGMSLRHVFAVERRLNQFDDLLRKLERTPYPH